MAILLFLLIDSETVLSYTKLVAELDQTVMKMVSESYGIEEHYKPLQESICYLFKMIKYRTPKESEKNIGLIPHTDKTFMSIVHQHQVKGFEMKMKDGEWMLVDPSPSSFLVLAGDAIMVRQIHLNPQIPQITIIWVNYLFSLKIYPKYYFIHLLLYIL